MTLSMLMQDEREEGREEGFAQGRAEGRVEGRAEGRASTLDAVAAFMRENGISTELVSKFEKSFSQA